MSDCVAQQGLMFTYWCFSLERFGGWLKSNLRNMKDPLITIANLVLKREQVSRHEFGRCENL